MSGNRKATLFVKNFPIEATEESLKSYFSYYGRVRTCNIPKDYYTGKSKGYAFVNFHGERDARYAQDNCRERPFMDKLLAVNFAYEKKPSRSRSRSHSPSPKIDPEYQMDIEILAKTKEELIKKTTEISKECEKLQLEYKELRELKKSLKKELSSLSASKAIFLPCGHSKSIGLQENAMYEDILHQATQYLSAKEAENPIIQKQLKLKVMEILNSKFPDTFRCKEKVGFIIGKCGHRSSTECYLMNVLRKGGKFMECSRLIEKLLPCGHIQFIECCKELEVIVCKKC